MPSVYAVGPWVLVELEPPPPVSEVLVTPDPVTPVRWATTLHVGPLVPDLSEGQRVLVSLNAAVAIGDHYLVPQSGVLLTEGA